MRIFQQNLIHISRMKLEQFPVRIKNNHRDVGFTQDSQFVSFLEETVFTFQERYLSISVVLDWSDRYFTSTHSSRRFE